MPYSKQEVIRVRITDAADEDKWMGRLPDGPVVFVLGPAAIGDLVDARIIKIKKAYLEARLTAVIEPGPDRVDAPCPHFGTCGGCKWQHVAYPKQLALKEKAVRDVLERIGGFAAPEVAPAIPADPIYGYRNKVDFTFSDRRFLEPHEMEEETPRDTSFAVGFHAPRQYGKVLDLEVCHLGTPEMTQVLHLVRRFALDRQLKPWSTKTNSGFLRNLVVRQSVATGEVLVNLITTWREEAVMEDLAGTLEAGLGADRLTFVNGISTRLNLVAVNDDSFVHRGTGRITEVLDGLSFGISPNSFFQTNTRQAERLARAAIDAAGLGPGTKVWDLFCGVGTLALFAARTGAEVTGLEVVPEAVEDAKENAMANQVESVRFGAADLMHFARDLPRLRERWGDPEVVILDPPRAGLHPKTVDGLVALAAPRLVYVSCKPASLARDAARLRDEAGYRLGPIQPVDMFPQTAHVEAVAMLER